MTQLDLAGKHALVVGGGQGMGRATALAQARAGADVAVIDAEPERAATVAAEVRDVGRAACALTADVTFADEAARGVAEARLGLGGLDIVVNIVGAASWAPLLELSEETWERDFALNLKHHWYPARGIPEGFDTPFLPDRQISYLALSGILLLASVGLRGWRRLGAEGSGCLASVCIGTTVAMLLLEVLAGVFPGFGNREIPANASPGGRSPLDLSHSGML